MTAVQQWWFAGNGGRSPLGRTVFREDFERADPAADYIRTSGGFSSFDFAIVDTPYGDKGAYFNTQLLLGGFTAYDRALGQEYTFNTVECKYKVSNLLAMDDAAILMFHRAGVMQMYFNPVREGTYDGERRCWFSFGDTIAPVSSATPEEDVWYRMVLRIRPGAYQSTVQLTRLDTNEVVHSETLAGSFSPITFDTIRFYGDSGGYTVPTTFDDIVCYNA